MEKFFSQEEINKILKESAERTNLIIDDAELGTSTKESKKKKEEKKKIDINRIIANEKARNEANKDELTKTSSGGFNRTNLPDELVEIYEEAMGVKLHKVSDSNTDQSNDTKPNKAIAKTIKSKDSKVVNKYDKNRDYYWKQIVIRFSSEEEQIQLKNNFKKSKSKNLSSFVRNRLLDRDFKVLYVDEDLEEIKDNIDKLIHKLMKVSSDHKKVVKHISSLGLRDDSDIREELDTLQYKYESLNDNIRKLMNLIKEI